MRARGTRRLEASLGAGWSFSGSSVKLALCSASLGDVADHDELDARCDRFVKAFPGVGGRFGDIGGDVARLDTVPGRKVVDGN